MMKQIYEILGEILDIDADEITSKMRLTKEDGVDPLAVAKLVIECEKTFHVTICDEDVHTFLNVKDIADYIENILYENTSHLRAD